MTEDDESAGLSENEERVELCQCGYILKHTPMSGVCPECGEVFLEDRGFVNTWRTTKFGAAKVSVALALAGLSLLCFTLVTMFSGAMPRPELLSPIIMFYAIFTIAGLACAMFRIRHPRDRIIARWGLSLSLLLLLNPCGLVLLLGFILKVTGTRF